MKLGKGIAISAATALLWGQGPPQRQPNQGSLKNVPLPQFTNADKYTKDQNALVILGKAFCDFPAGGTGPDVRRLNLSPDDRAAVTAFLKSLSDDRVRFEQAPFDHPELCVPIGGDTTQASSDPRFPLSVADKWAGIPAVGMQGNMVPLQTFDELLLGIGTDGSRAHTLTDTCAVP